MTRARVIAWLSAGFALLLVSFVHAGPPDSIPEPYGESGGGVDTGSRYGSPWSDRGGSGGSGGSGGGGTGNGKGRGGKGDNPDSCDPIELFTGDKRERATDLVVALTGEDYRLERMYTSRATGGVPGLPCGENWFLNASSYIKKDYHQSYNSTDGRVVVVDNPWTSFALYAPANSTNDLSVRFNEFGWSEGLNSTDDTFQYRSNNDVYAQRRVVRMSLTGLNESELLQSFATISVVQPGVRERLFYGMHDAADVNWFGTGGEDEWPGNVPPVDIVSAMESWRAGRLLQERDVYGNTKTYIWEDARADPLDDPLPQLSKIVCRTRGDGSVIGPIEAEIRFVWAAPGGRLERVEVWRPSGGDTQQGQQAFESQRAVYTYFQYGHHVSVGFDGDLVQVHTFERVDSFGQTLSLANSRVKVWQYRYHRLGEFDPELGGLEPFDCLECITLPEEFGAGETSGVFHQLKMVIEPEAIEYATHVRNVNIGGSLTVLDRAAEILTLASIDTALVEGTTPRTVKELSSKFIQYNLTQGEPAHVVLQEFGGSCGCGGGSGGAVGRRLIYSYAEASGDPADGAWEATVRMREFIKSPGGGTEWAEHQDHYYDLTFFEQSSDIAVAPKPIPYLLNEAVVERVSDGMGGYTNGQMWVTHYEYADADLSANGLQPLLSKVYTPSATASYTPANVDADPPTGPTWTAATNRGRVETYTYGPSLKLHEAGVQVGTGTTRVQVETEYFTLSDPDGHPHLPKSRRRYVDGSLAEEVEYSYGFYPNPLDELQDEFEAIAWVRTDVTAESVAENGPGGSESYTSFELFDRTGANTHSIDALGVRTSRTFDRGETNGAGFFVRGTGGLLEEIRNCGVFTTTDDDRYDGHVDSQGDSIVDSIDEILVSTYNSYDGDNSTNGGALKIVYARDYSGRLIQMTSPGGVTVTTRRTLESEPFERSTIPLYVETTLPFSYTEGSVVRYNGPARKRWITAGGNVVRESEYEITLTSGYDPLTLDPRAQSSGVIDPANESARHTATVPLSGLVTRRAVWSDLSQTDPDIIEHSVYDGLGRLALHVDPVLNAERYTYDVFDRLIEVERGTQESETLVALALGAGNLVTVREMIYDEYFDSVNSTWNPGSGNGLLTSVIEYPSPGNTRETNYVYDDEERRIAVANPLPPHTAYSLDGQGRVVAEAQIGGPRTAFRNAAEGGADYFSTQNTDRVRLYETLYGSRGLVYRTREAIEPAGDPDDSQFAWLETNYWFDAKGRTIAVWGPNGPGMKTAYDGLDRPVAMYYTDRGGDAAPGTSGNYADVWDATAGELDLDGDTVFEQVEYTYVTDTDGAGTHVGQRVLATSRQRLHDSSFTSALVGGNSVANFSGYGYDGADRSVLQINFGTNGAGFETGTSAPTGGGAGGTFVLADAEPDSVYSRTEYDDEGHVVAAISSGNGLTGQSETRTAFFYDDAHRRIGVIENHDETASIVRDTGGTPVQWGWILWNAGAAADENRATIFRYDPAGNMTHLVAARHDFVGGTEYQVTRYTYEARTTDDDLEGPVNDVTNLVNSNSALTKVEYPMAVDGDDATDIVHYRVNALGETIAMQDQNGTVHEYELDELGRLVNDRVAAGSGVYATIDRLWMDYDDAGRFAEAKSYNATSVLNAVKFEYTGLGQVWKVVQNPVGDIGTLSVDGTAEVEYDYADADVDRGMSPAPSNYSRRTDLLYPSAPSGGRTNAQLEYAAGRDSAISRPSAIDTVRGSSSHRVNYDFIGMSMLAVKEHEAIHHRLDRFKNPLDGVETSGEYPGYDHLGRVAGQLWIWTDGNGDWDAQGNPALPGVVRPALADFRYSYDTASNVLNRLDRRASHHTDPHGASMTGVDERYRYDGLNRLLAADRGRQSGTWSFSTHDPRGQQWGVDLLGNWSQSIANTAISGGDQNNYDAEDTVDERRHNAANEILDPAAPTTAWGRQITVNSGTPDQRRYEYDNNGNMTARIDMATGDKWGYGYDAWNRLVHVYVQPDSESVPPGAINDRVFYRYNPLHWRVRRTGIDVFNPAVLEADSRYYYDADWRLLEERTDFVDELVGGGGPGGLGEDPPEPTSWAPDEITQWVWGMEYIDELLSFMRDTEDGSAQTPPDGRFDDSAVKVYHAAHDRLYSVIALLDGTTGSIAERVRYNAYGLARQQGRGDVNGDGLVNFSDQNAILTNYGGSLSDTMSPYNVHADLNADGVVGFGDQNLYFGAPTPPADGLISADSVRNTVGYAGYIHDPAAGPDGGMNLARHRWLDPVLGRWVTRDPIGYWGGFNLTEYALSDPTSLVDAGGQRPTPHCTSQSTSVHIMGGTAVEGGVGVVPRATANVNLVLERRNCSVKCCENGSESTSLHEELSIYFRSQIDVGVTVGARFGVKVKPPVLGIINVSAYAGIDLAGGFQGEGRGSLERSGSCGEGLSEDRAVTLCARGTLGVHGRFGAMANVRVRRWNYEAGIEGTASIGGYGSVCIVCDSSGCQIDMSRTTLELERRIIMQGRVCVGFGCATARWNYKF